jgi:pseudaminic acid biosynthesis-associated methylase
MNNTEQEQFWKGTFGKEYTDRNNYTIDELDQFYQDRYGIEKKEMDEAFLSDVPKTSKILEVGCNIGMQLRGFQRLGYESLSGIDIQWYAIEKARENIKHANLIQSSALDIPFKDGHFDLVFTHGVLIHVSPDEIGEVMDEMYRCSSKYIFGLEYYSDEPKSLPYRGNDGFLWKANYCQMFLDRFSDLKLVKEQKLPYKNEDGLEDSVYLLAKS